MIWTALTCTAIVFYVLGLLTGRAIHRMDFEENGADE